MPPHESYRLNAKVWDYTPDLDISQLPLPVDILPKHVKSLKECARHQILSLLAREGPGMTEDEEDAIDDGFVLCDLNVVQNKYLAWRRLFPRLRPFFALKCNPDPMVAGVLGQLGAGFDCASVPEILLALDSTRRDPSSLIYANPQRAEKDLETALAANVKTLTFDGAEELYKVHRVHHKIIEQSRLRHNAHQQHQPTSTPPSPFIPPSPPDMVLRMLVPDKHSTVPLGEKFGVPPDQIEGLVELAADLELPIVGISFHCGSGNHDPGAYRVAIEMASQAAKTVEQVQERRRGQEARRRCRLIDIGGGFPGRDGCGADGGRFVGNNETSIAGMEAAKDGNEQETALKISEAVVPLLEELYPTSGSNNDGGLSKGSDFLFIAEPGRYFVEAAFALCSRIYRVKIVEGKQGADGSSQEEHRHYYIGQGVQGVFKDCILCGESFLPVPLAIESAGDDSENSREGLDPVPCTVHGPSGEDYDVVCRDHPLPPLEVGDWLLFDRMGAYTLSIAARSGRPAIRYVLGGSRLPPFRHGDGRY